MYCCVLNFVLLCIELCHYLCLFCTLAFLQIWQVCGRGGFPHIFLALIWAMPVSMPVLCLESHSQTLPVKVTKWPSSSTMHVRDMQALWHEPGWGSVWFVYPRANSKTLNLIHRAASEYFTLHPEKKLQFLTLFNFNQFTPQEKMPDMFKSARMLFSVSRLSACNQVTPKHYWHNHR